MAHRHFAFENNGVRSVANVKHGIILDVGSIAYPDVMNVATDGAVAPD
jgi:hypothetical protein